MATEEALRDAQERLQAKRRALGIVPAQPQTLAPVLAKLKPLQIGSEKNQPQTNFPSVAEPPNPSSDPHPLSALFQDREFWKRAVSLQSLLASAGAFVSDGPATLAKFDASVQDRCLTPRAQIGMCISGPAGRGKTWLAVACLRIHVLRGKSCRFVLAGDLLSEIRESYGDHAQRSERSIVEEVCAHDCLVLDDLGREGGDRNNAASSHALSVLHRLLTKRIGMQRRTIVTSNRSANELADFYDDAIGSRLGSFEQIILLGNDRRRQ